MLDIEYLYLGGPFDGQWRRPFNVLPDGSPASQLYPRGEGEQPGTYIATKFGHMAGFGEGEFRMRCVVMLDEPWNTLLTEKSSLEGPRLGYATRLERALVHRIFREHLQRTWRVPEVLDFGPAWLAMERRPVEPKTRPIRDNPQA